MKTARTQFKRWLKHWYLGGGTMENRDFLTYEAKVEEQMIYREFQSMIDQLISENASELSVPKVNRERKGDKWKK